MESIVDENVKLLSEKIQKFNSDSEKDEFTLSGTLYSLKTKKNSDSDIIDSNRCRLYLSSMKYIDIYIPTYLLSTILKTNPLGLRQKTMVNAVGFLQIYYNENSITPIFQMYCRKVYPINSDFTSYIASENSSPKPFPSKLKQIAVISSTGSDGYDDFIDILYEELQSKVKFYPVSFGSFNAVNEIISSMNKAADDGCDIICIVRGGGDSIGFRFVFDDKNLCDHIAASNIPVYIGAGHTKDKTNADIVSDAPSGCYFNTPSVLANFINKSYTTIYNNSVRQKDLSGSSNQVQQKCDDRVKQSSNTSSEFNPFVDSILKFLSVVIVFALVYWFFFK